MAKQNEPKKLSEIDLSLIGTYKTVFGIEFEVVKRIEKRTMDEILEMGNVMPIGHNRLFYKVEPSYLRGQIKANIITKI